MMFSLTSSKTFSDKNNKNNKMVHWYNKISKSAHNGGNI